MLTRAFLAYVQRLHQLVLAQADDLQPALNRITESSPPGSPAAKDYNTVRQSVRSEDRQALWGQVQFDCMHMAVNVADHVRSLAVLLARPDVSVPIYAHTTLTRAAIEGAANVAYIHDSASPFELRFARGIALLVSDGDMARRAANRVPGNAFMPTPGPAATKQYEKLLAHIGRARIDIIPNKDGDPKAIRLGPAGTTAVINVKMTDLVHERYPNMPALYNIMSGIAHGMPHRLNDNAAIAGRGIRWEPNPLDIGTSALAAMRAAQTTLAAHAWHRGREDDPSIAAVQNRVDAVDAEILRYARDHLPRPRPAPVARFLSS